MSASSGAISSIVVNGVTLEATERGQGRPILFLHPGIGIDADAPVLDALAKGGRVIAPTHPGFGKSQLPKGLSTVDDLSYFYLDLIEQRDLRDILVVGIGIGGWIAAEMAVKSTERLSALVLGNPVGVKVSDRETRDIVDIWSLTADDLLARSYFDPNNGKHDYKTLPEDYSLRAARNREATARFAWSPYMHNPKLKGPAAPDQHSDAVPVGRRRPHHQRRIRTRLLRDDPRRDVPADRTRRTLSAHRTAG
jgi:pimeloyl-ACP methyl ester carboxylesterase